ncbi:MAG TPA: zinc-dependent alcohol dehydrogenase family protein [Aliidongia sp.]|nr:zinc-dependent alcohol dehydrogenase family protein [Aliidongia sp.]
MRSLVFQEFGEPSAVLKLTERPMPTPTPAGVVLRVTMRPINPSDLSIVRGHYGRLPKLPAVPGLEAVGRIEAVGDDVADWVPGQRVIPLGVEGTWTEAMAVPEQVLLAVPDEMPDQIACQMLVNPLTAYLLLFEVLKAKPGDWVIQSAAGSALGRMLIQLAAINGINLINVIRRRAAAEALKAAGAAHIVVTEDEDVAERVAAIAGRTPVIKAIDAVGGATGAKLMAALGYGGMFVLYGALSREAVPIDPARLIFRGLTVKGFWLSDWFRATARETRDKTVGEVMKLLASGRMVPPVEAEYDLADYGQAVVHAERTGRLGKILLIG